MTESRRLLFVNDFLSGGGAEVVMHQLKAGLEALSPPWTVRIFSAGETPAVQAGNPLSYLYSWGARRRLARMLREFNPDVVHVLNYYHLLSPSVLDTLKSWKRMDPRRRVVHTAHDFHLLCPSSGLTSFTPGGEMVRLPAKKVTVHKGFLSLLRTRWDHRGRIFSLLKFFQWYMAYGVRRSERVFDGIIAPGGYMHRILSRTFPEIPVSLIRNPYHPLPEILNRFSPPDPGNPVRMVFAGRLGREKGLAEFLRSLNSSMNTAWELDIYGAGPEESVLKELIREGGLQDRCCLKGPLAHEAVLKILPSYHTLVLPSLWYENAPLSLVEGAFNGLWLLVSDWGGVRDIARFCGGAVFMDPGSAESVSKALGDLYRMVRTEGSPQRDEQKLKSAYSFTGILDEHLRIYRGTQG